MLRIVSGKQEQIITTNNNLYETKNQGKILGRDITSNGYYRHLQQRKNIAIQS